MNTVPRFLPSLNTLYPVLMIVVFAALALTFPGTALAEGDAAAGLPYQKGIDTFYKSMTGPVPFIISLMGIVGCGAMLIFGGEISGFMRTMVFIVLVVAVMVQANSIVSLLGGSWTGDEAGQITATSVLPASGHPV